MSLPGHRRAADLLALANRFPRRSDGNPSRPICSNVTPSMSKYCVFQPGKRRIRSIHTACSGSFITSSPESIVAGDAFLFQPSEAHQLINDGDVDLIVYVVADNPLGESGHVPDSKKYSVQSPKHAVIRGEHVPYYDGEDS